MIEIHRAQKFCFAIVFLVVSLSQETGKSIPLQAWRGPEGSRRFRLPDFKTIST